MRVGVEEDERTLVVSNLNLARLEYMLREDELLSIEKEMIVYSNTSNPQLLQLDVHLHDAVYFIEDFCLKTNRFWILLPSLSKSKAEGTSSSSQISSLDNKRSMVDTEATQP